jgi:hypothetical protein
MLYEFAGWALADAPFSHGKVDHPAAPINKAFSNSFTVPSVKAPTIPGQHLCGLPHTNGIGACHPGLVLTDVRLTDRDESNDDGHDHARSEKEA